MKTMPDSSATRLASLSASSTVEPKSTTSAPWSWVAAILGRAATRGM